MAAHGHLKNEFTEDEKCHILLRWLISVFYCLSQVLKGDIQPAIELHEMLYQVMQRHNFLPEVGQLCLHKQDLYLSIIPFTYDVKRSHLCCSDEDKF